jgi:hypothetical protein
MLSLILLNVVRPSVNLFNVTAPCCDSISHLVLMWQLPLSEIVKIHFLCFLPFPPFSFSAFPTISSFQLLNGSFTLAKASAIMPVTATATCDSHYLPWQRNINRNYPICVVSPKVAKASTMVTVSRVAVASVIALHFANVNAA